MDFSFSENGYFLSSVSFFFPNLDPDMNKYANMFTLLAFSKMLRNRLLDAWPINIGSLPKNLFRCVIEKEQTTGLKKKNLMVKVQYCSISLTKPA